jgi:hypothetical protein
VEGRSIEFAKSYEESGPGTAVFFILSPGVDPLKDVETLGKKLGFTFDNNNFHNVSLGQGQEVVAERAMDVGAKEGHWVVLQVGSCIQIHGEYHCCRIPQIIKTYSRQACYKASNIILLKQTVILF